KIRFFPLPGYDSGTEPVNRVTRKGCGIWHSPEGLGQEYLLWPAGIRPLLAGSYLLNLHRSLCDRGAILAKILIRGGDLDLVEYEFQPFVPGQCIKTLGL